MNFIKQWIDVLVFAVFMAMHVKALYEDRKKYVSEPKNELIDRQFSATTLNSASGTGVTAVSILVPASLLIIQIASDSHTIPRIAMEYVFRGSIWFLVSLALGLFILFVIPTQSQAHNVARRMMTMIPFGPQLACLIIGMIWLVIGIYTAVYPR
ncbi:MAG: hypothetical protein ABI228_04150 [Burkholderiaceae bacterium]